MLSGAVLLLMQGCAMSSATPEPQINTQNLSQESQTGSSNAKLSQLAGKNYIKGIVMSVKMEGTQGIWNYVIEGIDTSNGKLSYVNFNHKAVVANEGDMVYASFDGMKLTEMLIIKAGYYKNGKRNTTAPTKKAVPEKGAGKRDKAHQVLGVPQEEFIKLN